jgi:hypothetical protein
LFQNGLLQQKLAALSAIPGPWVPGTTVESDQRNGGNDGLNGFDLLRRLGSGGTSTQMKQHAELANAVKRVGGESEMHPAVDLEAASSRDSYAHAPKYSQGVGSLQGYNLPAAGGSLGEGAARAFGGAEGNGAFAVPLAPVVALNGAVAPELANTASQNGAGMEGDLVATARSLGSPNETSDDASHVKVISQRVSYQSHMPTGPTSSLPSQSLPIPGQVLFSP